MQRKLMLFLLFLTVMTKIAFAVTAPSQPASGPGSAIYPHASWTRHEYGEGPTRYWIFEPAGPAPSSAPLVVFNHGWGGMNPKTYGAWIEHIVRRGNIVIFPVYQENLRTPMVDFLPNAIIAVKDALRVLQGEGHVRPLLDQCAVVGHSMGGLITADMAAVAAKEGLPQFKAVMSVEPGKTWGKTKRMAYPLSDLSKIPASTLLLTVAGDADTVVKDIDAKKIFNEASAVPQENKNYIVVVSDGHGEPPLKATHFAPVASDKKLDSGERTLGNGGAIRAKIREQFNARGTSDNQERDNRVNRGRIREKLKARFQQENAERSDIQDPAETQPLIENDGNGLDALDYYAYWKLFDALSDAAFYDKNREYALGNTPQQRFMGKWSDGVPVKELIAK